MLSVDSIARIIVGPREATPNGSKRTLAELRAIRWDMETSCARGDATHAAKAIVRAIDDAERQRVAGKTFRTLGSVVGAEVYQERRMVVFRIKLNDASEAVLPYTINSDTDFGNKRLAQLLKACGVTHITDTDQLHNIEFIVSHRMGTVRKVECAVLTQFVHPERAGSWWDWLKRR